MRLKAPPIAITQRFLAQLLSQGVAAFGALALTLLIGFVGGPELLGQFAVLMALLGVLQLVAGRGQSTLVARATAWTEYKYGRATSRDVGLRSVGMVLLPSALMGLAGAGLLASGQLGTPFPGAVISFPLLLAIICTLAVLAGYMRGTQRAWAGPMLENGGISFLATMILGGVVLFAGAFSPFLALLVFTLCAGLLLATALAVLLREAPFSRAKLKESEDLRSELETGQWAFVGIGLGSYLVQAGALVLGAPFLSDEELGLLRAAERLAIVVGFPILCMVPLLVPRLVPAIRTHNNQELRTTILLATLAAAFLGGAPMVALMIFPAEILSLIGAQFIGGADWLRAMAVLQFVTALVGPLALVLNLSGREKTSMYIHWVVLGVAATTIPVLSSTFGVFGFVLALAITTCVRSGLLGGAALLAMRAISLEDTAESSQGPLREDQKAG